MFSPSQTDVAEDVKSATGPQPPPNIVTVIVFEVPEQFPVVVVTLYVPAVLTVIDCVVSPLDHK